MSFIVLDPSGREVMVREGHGLTVIENGWRATSKGKKEYAATRPMAFAFCCCAKEFAASMFGCGCRVLSNFGNYDYVEHTWNGKRWSSRRPNPEAKRRKRGGEAD